MCEATCQNGMVDVTLVDIIDEMCLVLRTSEGNKIRSRLISSRETARLMGLPDDYKLPESYNEAYHLTGDGVAVPVVDYIARNLLDPIFSKSRKNREAA